MYNIPFFLCLKSHPLINFLQASGSAGTRQIYPPSRHPPLVRGRIFLPVLCPFPGCSFSYSTFSWIYHFTNLLPTRSFFKLFVFLPLSRYVVCYKGNNPETQNLRAIDIFLSLLLNFMVEYNYRRIIASNDLITFHRCFLQRRTTFPCILYLVSPKSCFSSQVFRATGRWIP